MPILPWPRGRDAADVGGKRRGHIPQIDVHVVELPAQASPTAIAHALKGHPHLKFAEPDMLVSPDFTPHDPYLGSAWHLPKIAAPQAWDSSTGSDMTVAILDTGVDSAHPDLAAKIVPGWNFYDNNSNTADVHGHGTAVAGTAAAAAGMGVAAVLGPASIRNERRGTSRRRTTWW